MSISNLKFSNFTSGKYVFDKKKKDYSQIVLLISRYAAKFRKSFIFTADICNV